MGHGFGGASMAEEHRLPIEGVVVALARKVGGNRRFRALVAAVHRVAGS